MEEQNREFQSKTNQGKSEHDEAESFGAFRERIKGREGALQEQEQSKNTSHHSKP